jgi:biotin carboxyl carrier protein
MAVEEEFEMGELLAEEEEARMEVKVDVSKVKEFLLNVVETTDLAEIDLQIGDLELYVLRKMEASPAPPAAAAPTPAAAAAAAPASAAQAQGTSAQAQPSSTESAAGSLLRELESLEESIDESAIKQTCDTVGTFRRGRYLKGKKIGSKPMVEVGDVVKKGQTIAFVEQMQTFTPVLAKQAGEITQFDVEEGDPVGYGQLLVSLYPFFGGHIIGESKHV